MKFKEWFYSEAVEFVHENFTQFYRKWNNRILRVERQLFSFNFEMLNRELQSFDRGGENECSNRIINWASSSTKFANQIAWTLKGFTSKPSELADLERSLNYYETLEKLKDYGTIFRIFRSIFEINQSNHNYAEYLKDMKEEFAGKSVENFVAYTCGEEAVASFMRCYNGMNNLISLVETMQSLMREFDSEMGTWVRSQSRIRKTEFKTSDVSEQMPSHEPFEYLYHASSNVPAIMKVGFKTKKELGKPTGLGGGSSDLISFTSNPRIARSIANSLKMAVRVAKGEISFEDIIQKYKRFGLVKDNDIWNAKGNSHDPKEQAFNLYRRILSEIQTKGIGYNPVFGSPVFEEFSKTNLADIGVVIARIDMSKVQEYLPAEEEYRVPVGAISNVSVVK